MTDHEQTRLRLARLEERVRVLERRAGIAPRAAGEPEASEPEPPPFVPPPVAPAGTPVPPRTRDPAHLVRMSPTPRPGVRPAHLRPTGHTIKEQSVGHHSSGSIERQIGARWFGAIGAVVVIIGIGLFAKLAYDWGWFKVLTPPIRCGLGAGFGLLLLLAGEALRRKVNVLAGAGMTAAGLGSIYASTYAAYGFYDLLPPPVAFALLGGCALLGVAIGARARIVFVACLSLATGYLTPVLMHESESAPWVLPAYLLMLSVVGVGLAAWKQGSYRLVRAVAWIGTLLLGTLWWWQAGRDDPLLTVLFIAGTWLVYQVELVSSAAREKLNLHVEEPDLSLFGGALALVSCLSTTVWFVAIGLWTWHETGLEAPWIIPGGALVACVLAAQASHRGSFRLRIGEGNDGERLALLMWAKAAALLIATIALAFGGGLQIVTWLALGVGAVLVSRTLRVRVVGWYGLLLLVIASSRLLFYDSFSWLHHATGPTFGGLVLTQWMGLMALASASWVVVAVALRRVEPDGMCASLANAGCVLLLASLVHREADGAALAVAWAVLAAGVLLAGALARWLHLWSSAMLGLFCASGALFAGHTWLAWAGHPSAPFLHPGMWTGLLISGVCVLGAWTMRKRGAGSIGVIFTVGACAMFFIVTSLEVARVSDIVIVDESAAAAAVSIWWGLLAVGALVVGFRRRLPVVRYVGLGLLAVATSKALIFDIIEVQAVWRVISVIGLGMFMLGVGAGYAAVSKRLAREEDE